MVAAQRKSDPNRLQQLLRGDLDWIVMKALEKDRNRRYETANAFAADVQRYLHDEPVAACPPSALYRMRKYTRRHKGAFRTAIAAAGVLLLAGFGVGWVMLDRAAQEASRQKEQSERAATTERAVLTALAKAEQLRDRAAESPTTTLEGADAVLLLWGQAEAAVAQAEAAAKTGTADDRLLQRMLIMQRQCEQGRKHAEGHRALLKLKTKLLCDLEDARMALATIVKSQFDYAGAGKKYAAAFAAYGMVIQTGPIQDLAPRIRAEEPIMREKLIVAVDSWGSIAGRLGKDERLAAQLDALARTADDDPWRRRFRTASVSKDREALRNLSADARQLSPPPAVLQLLAWSLQDGGEIDEAVTLLRWAHERHPTDFWIAFDLGCFLQQRSSRTSSEIEEEIGCFRVALALRPLASTVYNSLGMALRAKEQFDAAVAAYRKALDIEPTDVWVYNNLAIALLDNKQEHEAFKVLRKGIEKNPNDAWAYLNLATALRDNKQVDEAFTVLRKAIEVNPKDAEAYTNLAFALRDNKKVDEAIAMFRMAIEVNPKCAGLQQPCSRWRLVAKNQLADAIAAYSTAIDMDPKDVGAYRNLASALRDSNHVDESTAVLQMALAMLRKGIEVNPRDSSAFTRLLFSCMKTSNWTRLSPCFEGPSKSIPKMHSYTPTSP